VPRTPLLRPGRIFLCGLLWGGIYFVIGLYFTQDIRDGIDASGFVAPVWGRVPSGITVLWMLSYIGAFMISVVSVFKRNFLNAICLIVVVCSSPLYGHAMRAIRGDRYNFTNGTGRLLISTASGARSLLLPGRTSFLSKISVTRQIYALVGSCGTRPLRAIWKRTWVVGIDQSPPYSCSCPGKFLIA
jgi:hypothetical protein